MALTKTAHATLWFVDELPVRMLYAGHRWRVSDVPTRLRESIWGAPLSDPGSLYGWRFQATDENQRSLVFDVYRADEMSWHVHHSWE